jgi:DNA-binding NarL/FixJ family response regulator
MAFPVFPTLGGRFGWDDQSVARSVLIIDDDPAFRHLAGRLLASAGLDVVGEADGVQEAIRAANRIKPDAALVDVDLPDGNGIDLAHELTALPWRPRVVLTSVDAEAARPEEVRRSGAQAFVHKADLGDGMLRELFKVE